MSPQLSPDKGETVGEIFGRVAPHPKAPKLQPDSDGLLWVAADAFRDAIGIPALSNAIGGWVNDPENVGES